MTGMTDLIELEMCLGVTLVQYMYLPNALTEAFGGGTPSLGEILLQNAYRKIQELDPLTWIVG